MTAPAPRTVIFFDLWGTLLRRTGETSALLPTAGEMLRNLAGHRFGILCNLPAGQTARDVYFLLESVGIVDRFSRELIVVASTLPTPLPDRRAFAVAAALAETPVSDCLYISADPGRSVAAAAAGMKLGNAPVAATITFTEAVAAPVRESDPDTGPTFVLKGRIVTMTGAADDVIASGWIAVQRGKIAALGANTTPLPATFRNAVTIDTDGTIYPGLMDLHNHLAYNVLPLWSVPKRYGNRGQWPRDPSYAPTVSIPINILGSYTPTARAIVRYIEVKALLGGTTTAQGVRSRQGGMTRLYRGSMRTVEQTDDPRLPEAGSKVLNYRADDAQDTASFKSALNANKAYFYHLAEGTDAEALSHFLDLTKNGLVQPALVGIHSLGLAPANLRTMAQHGAKVVWSPFSNLLLYGQTLDARALKESGVQFSIGCDWSPTGSKNLLEELKVARFISRQQGSPFSSRELVQAVTKSAAEILAWQQYLGSLRAGMFADLVVIAGQSGDPYDLLIDATEERVQLVTVHGTPRVAEPAIMKQLHVDTAHPAETIALGSRSQSLNHYSELSPLADLSVQSATATLQQAMADLPAFYERTKREAAQASALELSGESFTLELDNEFDAEQGSPTTSRELAALELAVDPGSRVAKSIALDTLSVKTGGHLSTIKTEKNLSPELKDMLVAAYR